MSTTAAPSNAKTNPIVFMDISIGGQPIGRMQMELFADKVPKTAENFRYSLMTRVVWGLISILYRQLCTGEHRVNGVPQGYKNTSFHRYVSVQNRFN